MIHVSAMESAAGQGVPECVLITSREGKDERRHIKVVNKSVVINVAENRPTAASLEVPDHQGVQMIRDRSV